MKKISLLYLIPLLLLGGCHNKEKTESQSPQSEPVLVNTATAEELDFNGDMVYTGTFAPFREANLGTSIPGKVEKILIPEGGYVKEGELIVVLNSEAMLMAEIEYTTLQKDYERVSRLKEKNSVSDQDFDHAKALYEASKAKYDLLKKNTEIRAPFSGIVSEHLVQEGENYFFSFSMDPGYSLTSGIVRLMQTNPLLLEIEVNECDLPSIIIGNVVQISAHAYPDELLSGTVYQIATNLSTIKRTGKVTVLVNNLGGKIKPGMSATAHLKLPARKAIFIPLSAIHKTPGTSENFVYVISDNMAHKTPVTILGVQGDKVAVDGITKGEIIAVTGKNKLYDKANVKISK